MLAFDQARSQEFAMGGAVFRGLGAKPPAAGDTKNLHFFSRKICIFLQK